MKLKHIRYNQEFRFNGGICHLRWYADTKRDGYYTTVAIRDRHGTETYVDWETEVEVLEKR